MTATMQTLQNILKNFYIGPVRENLNNATVLLANVKKSSKEVVGEQVILPLRTGRNWGVGARGTSGNGTLPASGNQQYSKATFTTKDVYGRIGIRGKTIRATKTDKGAFLRAVQSETQGMVKDLASDINRQFFGDATGVLATVAANATSATITVDNTQYIEEGMILDIGGDTGVIVQSVDSETQFTLTDSITVVAAEVIRITGVGATDELNGLDLITDNTGALEGIDPSTGYAGWKGEKFGNDASPVPLDEDDMQQVQDEIERNGGDCDLLITSYAGRRQYVKLLTDIKRFTNPGVTALKGGFKAIDFNDKPLVVDRHCQESSTTTRMYFLSRKSLGIYRMADFDWMQEDGAILARQVGSGATESYEATLVCDMEFATDARRHNGRLEGIATS